MKHMLDFDGENDYEVLLANPHVQDIDVIARRPWGRFRGQKEGDL